MLNGLIAVVLVAVSLGMLVYLTALLWNAAWFPVGALFERRRFERYAVHAHGGDRYLRDGALSLALSEFNLAFYPYPGRTRAMAQAVLKHHTGLLSRLIAAADHVQGERVRLMSLAKVDRLFHERDALQRRYLALRQSGSRQRLRDLEREFRANTRELRAALGALAAEIEAAQAVQYH